MGEASEHDYQKVEEDAIKSEYMAKMNNGEMYFVAGNESFKAVSSAPTDFNLSFKEKVLGDNLHIPLNQLYPKRKLVEVLRENRHKLFTKSYLYHNSIEQISNYLNRESA